jgi:hypothetical protein
MNSYKCKASSLAAIGTALLIAIGLFNRPAYARFGGGFGGGGFGRFGGGFGRGGFGRFGGGFRMGGDGFAGGNPSHTAWSRPDYSSHPYGSSYSDYHPNSSNFPSFDSTNQTARYNEANSMNQSRSNEAQSMQNQHYQNQSALSHQQYNQASNLQSNSNGNWDPYRGCCGSSGGSTGAGAAVGMMGGMAMGAAMESAVQPRQSTTIVENAAAPSYAAPLTYLPPGSAPTQINGSEYFYSNGTYYKPEFNGSQVVYVPSPM